MINIIKSILDHCGYEYVSQRWLEYQEKKFSIDILKNKEVGSQIFLVLSILESRMLEIDVTGEFLIEIADAFRESEVYMPEMDKNTSLVYCVEKDVDSNKTDILKVAIEDDPYYFKKYVFTYSLAEVSKFTALCKQYNESANDFIQKYILNTENFSRFKKNADNEDIYRMVSELVIKLPVVPIKFIKQQEINTISDYMKDIKKGSDDEIEKLDQIIECLQDTEKSMEDAINIILEKWGYEEGDKNE
jgi:hypothetical protein